MVSQFLKRSVKRGGVRARLNQEIIFQTWRVRRSNRQTMLEPVSGTRKGIELGRIKTQFLTHKL